MDIDTLSFIGNYSSIIGLIISLVTLILLYNLRKSFLFKSSITDYRKELIDINNDINSLFNSYNDNLNDISERFSIVNIKLRNIQKGAKKELLADVKKTRKLIEKFNSNKVYLVFKNNKYLNEDLARKIKMSIFEIIEELNNVQKEINVGAQ